VRCEQFQQRLNQLLDERKAWESDAQLAAHSDQCADCRALAGGLESLLAGLDARTMPELSADFTEKTLRRIERDRAPRLAWRRAAAPLALAAAVLVTVAAWRWLPHDPNSNFGAPGGRTPTAREAPADEFASEQQSQIDYLAMFHRTGQAMAVLPNTVRHTSVPEELASVAEGFRPVTESFSAMLDTLRRTLPGKSDAAKQSASEAGET
jgi:hypothetical protein